MAAHVIFRSDVAVMLMTTLANVVYTKDKGAIDVNDYYDVGNMNGPYVDELEVAGPGLASEVEEGQVFPAGTIDEGNVTRYRARKVGIELAMTQEVMEDGPSEWKKVIDAAMHCERSVRKTAEVDGASFLANGFSTSYPVADGAALFSASHTTPGGGSYSNLMATPLGPSYQGIVNAISDCKVMPDLEGLRSGQKVEAILHPVEQWAQWRTVLGSSMQPIPGNYAAINVVNRDMNIKTVAIRFWDSSSTQWAIKTDADRGLTWKWRVRPESTSRVDEGREIIINKRRARYSFGATNFRGVYGVNA
jgi:hypothetical protein